MLHASIVKRVTACLALTAQAGSVQKAIPLAKEILQTHGIRNGLVVHHGVKIEHL